MVFQIIFASYSRRKPYTQVYDDYRTSSSSSAGPIELAIWMISRLVDGSTTTATQCPGRCITKHTVFVSVMLVTGCRS